MLEYADFGPAHLHKYTWHSFRALKVTVMRENGASPQEIVTETGHKSLESLRSYDQLSVEAQYRLQHLNMGQPFRATGSLLSTSNTSSTNSPSTSYRKPPPPPPPPPPPNMTNSAAEQHHPEEKEKEKPPPPPRYSSSFDFFLNTIGGRVILILAFGLKWN